MNFFGKCKEDSLFDILRDYCISLSGDMDTDADRIAYLEKELIKERYGAELGCEMRRLDQELPIGTSLQVIFDQALSIVKERHPV